VKRRPTISGALAVIALLLAAGGTAYAASSYIITSTHQIKPSVLAQLHGQRGERGYTGKQGKTGANGTNGGTTNGAPPAQGVVDNAGPAGAAGAAGQSGAAGVNGTNGPAGATGATGQVGAAGANGTDGTDGTDGAAGAAGASGINNPLVVTASSTSVGPDSGDCGNTWATDTYDRTWTIEPQEDGSYTIYEQVKGTFVTTAGASQPNPSSCSDNTGQDGGVAGTFYGVETWAVSAPGGESADFDPFAVCTSACDPTTTGSTSSNDQGNQAFEALFFPTATYAGVTNYDFVYHTDGNGSWVDSNTPSNNNGNITG
jgi:collagen type I/II/III/V/XI/XXIV/XXVII alpha